MEVSYNFCAIIMEVQNYVLLWNCYYIIGVLYYGSAVRVLLLWRCYYIGSAVNVEVLLYWKCGGSAVIMGVLFCWKCYHIGTCAIIQIYYAIIQIYYQQICTIALGIYYWVYILLGIYYWSI